MTSNMRCMQIICSSKEGALLQSQRKFIYNQTKKKEEEEEKERRGKGERWEEGRQGENISYIPDLWSQQDPQSLFSL